MDSKNRRKQTYMPGIHRREQREKEKEAGRWRKEAEAEPSLEGGNKRESEEDRETEIVSG